MSVVVLGVAFVNAQNAPIYLKRFDDDNSLDLWFIVHSALDSFDHRSSKKCYVGLLNLIDGCAVYGFVSNSLIKVIIVIDAEATDYVVPEDTDMENLVKKLYKFYVDAASNPFLEINSQLQQESEEAEYVLSGPKYPELVSKFDQGIFQFVKSYI